MIISLEPDLVNVICCQNLLTLDVKGLSLSDIVAWNQCGQESTVGEGIALLATKTNSVFHQTGKNKSKLLIMPLSPF